VKTTPRPPAEGKSAAAPEKAIASSPARISGYFKLPFIDRSDMA